MAEVDCSTGDGHECNFPTELLSVNFQNWGICKW